ncbi:RrF2 family transcriptional regulator [Campylobacter sputorum]|uniref:RrF2 family transcriptional regulator n=1 Tax=Campylobacter sputorum TaxID=206 RepID=UPI000B785EB1|nr:Rrf2 family transcriptional regulator [Campylobacter sputorum]ASM36844.1 transcriptional regulator, BadM/Rrf2 family [Campylobacter sputorum bv. faecalis CCUG 20703]
MLFTKASEYALLSLILLAKSNNPKDVENISKELNISKSFLAKILQNLAKNGVLKSTRGINGGFLLAKDPKQITIASIIEYAEKRPTNVFECSGDIENCHNQNGDICTIWPIFSKLQNIVDDFLKKITLKDIIQK